MSTADIMTAQERICFDAGMSQWDRSRTRHDMAERDRVKGALLAYQRQALAFAIMDRPTPEEIAAAWGAWHSRHGGKLGPGRAFVEAINAAYEARRRRAG